MLLYTLQILCRIAKMFWKLLMLTCSIYFVISVCHKKCICNEKKISCLQFDIRDEFEKDLQAEEIILRDSVCKLQNIKQAFPQLKHLTLVDSSIISENTQNTKAMARPTENQAKFTFWHTLYLIPLLIVAFLQAPVQNYPILLAQLNLLRPVIFGWINTMEKIINALRYLYRFLMGLKRLLGNT